MNRPSPLAEGIYRREVLPWALLGMTSGLVEGAMVSGAPALANISSFAWANLAHGRQRVGVLVSIQTLFALAVALLAFIPFGAAGLFVTIGIVILARLLWAGILTVRSAVWTANYPRSVLAQMTGRLVLVSSPGIALVAVSAGFIIDRDPQYARWLYAFAAACGLASAWLYRSLSLIHI